MYSSIHSLFTYSLLYLLIYLFPFSLDSFDPNPLVRHTFWSVQVLGLYFFVSTIGISQPQYQRLVSVKTLRISQM